MSIYWNDGTELYHYGILGQRWGHRRYQNPDGTLTEEGRRRYGITGATGKEYARDRRKRIKAEAEVIKSNKTLSAKEKARVLKGIGAHQDAAEQYQKDFVKKRRAMVLGNIAYKVAAAASTVALGKQVASGKMTMEQAKNVGRAANLGKKAVNAYLGINMYADAKNFKKEYWKLD